MVTARPRQIDRNPSAARPDSHAACETRSGTTGPVISTLARFVPGGKTRSGDNRPLTCRDTSCSALLAYRLQADHLGDLDSGSQRLLDNAVSPEAAGKRAVDNSRMNVDVRPGTMLAREWNGRMHRVAVLANGFAWTGKTYPSLSKIALAITGTRWNGPRFFGLRDKPAKEAGS